MRTRREIVSLKCLPLMQKLIPTNYARPNNHIAVQHNQRHICATYFQQNGAPVVTGVELENRFGTIGTGRTRCTNAGDQEEFPGPGMNNRVELISDEIYVIIRQIWDRAWVAFGYIFRPSSRG